MFAGVGRIRAQDVERRQGFTRPDHRSRCFSASTSEKSVQEEEAATKGEKVSACPIDLADRLMISINQERRRERKEGK